VSPCQKGNRSGDPAAIPVKLSSSHNPGMARRGTPRLPACWHFAWHFAEVSVTTMCSQQPTDTVSCHCTLKHMSNPARQTPHGNWAVVSLAPASAAAPHMVHEHPSPKNLPVFEGPLSLRMDAGSRGNSLAGVLIFMFKSWCGTK
jgi:hypothetical protein